MEALNKFQGVVCCHLSGDKTIKDLLSLDKTSKHHGLDCYHFELNNKYYKSTIHIFNYDLLTDETSKPKVLEECQAIIILGDGKTLSTEQLDGKLELLKSVGGEPRILVCDGIDESCEPHKTLLQWSVENSFDLLLTSEDDFKNRLIDSLSAYKWTHRVDVASGSRDNAEQPQLSSDVLKQIMNFDILLKKLSAYKDQPETRGNPNDENIEELAKLLSGLVGDDVDNFLDDDSSSHSSSITHD